MKKNPAEDVSKDLLKIGFFGWFFAIVAIVKACITAISKITDVQQRMVYEGNNENVGLPFKIFLLGLMHCQIANKQECYGRWFMLWGIAI